MLMFGAIYFDEKSFLKKAKPKEWNNRRISCAKRAINKQREKAGLFGEQLMKHTTVEQRLTEIDSSFINRIKYHRKNEANDLRTCRKEYKALPANIQKDIADHMRKYNFDTTRMFLSAIHNYKMDSLYFERLKGNASPYTRTYIIDGKPKVIEITQEENKILVDKFFNKKDI